MRYCLIDLRGIEKPIQPLRPVKQVRAVMKILIVEDKAPRLVADP